MNNNEISKQQNLIEKEDLQQDTIDFSDWVLLIGNSEIPLNESDPYQQNFCEIFTKLQLSQLTSEKQQSIRDNLIQSFHQFYNYFTARIGSCLENQQNKNFFPKNNQQLQEQLQEQQQQQEQLKNKQEKRKNWVNLLEDVISEEMIKIQKCMDQFFFTPAWVMKNCLDLLQICQQKKARQQKLQFSSSHSKQQATTSDKQNQQQQQIQNEESNKQEERNEMLQRFEEFLDENFVDLLACAASRDRFMLQELVGDRIGNISVDHCNKFKKKSLQICKDKHLQKEFIPNNNNKNQSIKQDEQDYLFKSCEDDDQKSLYRSWSSSQIKKNYLNRSILSNQQENINQICEEMEYSSLDFQIAKIEVLIKMRQFLHAFLIVQILLNSDYEQLNEQHQTTIKQLQSNIEQYFENEESDLVQIIIYQTLSNQLTSTKQIIQSVEALQFSEQDMRNFQMWLFFIQNLQAKQQKKRGKSHQKHQQQENQSSQFLQQSIIIIQEKLNQLQQLSMKQTNQNDLSMENIKNQNQNSSNPLDQPKQEKQQKANESANNNNIQQQQEVGAETFVIISKYSEEEDEEESKNDQFKNIKTNKNNNHQKAPNSLQQQQNQNDNKNINKINNFNCNDIKKYQVLSLDGGGIRGIIQLILLAELEARTGKPCNELFNFFAGTSIGAIIALALANGTTAESLLFDFLGRTRNKIFSERHYLRYILGLKCDSSNIVNQNQLPQQPMSQQQFGKVSEQEQSQVKKQQSNSSSISASGQIEQKNQQLKQQQQEQQQKIKLQHPLYDAVGLEQELLRFFGDLRLRDLGTNVLVSSCLVDGPTLKPCVFYNYALPNNSNNPVNDNNTTNSNSNNCSPQKVITGMTLVNGLRPLNPLSKISSSISFQKEQDEINFLFQDVLVRQIARASSAAYPFLSATEIANKQFVDGGFLFNNVDILVVNFLQQMGVQRENIQVLSLGNYPNDTEIKTTSLEQASTMAFGVWHELRNILNPETYYNDYFAAALTNFDHSITESRAVLDNYNEFSSNSNNVNQSALMLQDSSQQQQKQPPQRYVRLEPEYHGRFIQLDSTSPESLKELKEIGANWIESLDFTGQLDIICQQLLLDGQSQQQRNDIISQQDQTIAVVPRYYSYQDLYQPIEDALSEINLAENNQNEIAKKEKDLQWRQALLNFQFPKHEQAIIFPVNVLQSIKGMFKTSSAKLEDDGLLLAKAAAIGHIPSLKHILSAYEHDDDVQNQENALNKIIFDNVVYQGENNDNDQSNNEEYKSAQQQVNANLVKAEDIQQQTKIQQQKDSQNPKKIEIKMKKEELIQKPIVNGWNALHYAAANGEIAAFIYLISQIFHTRAFFSNDQNNLTVPQRVKRALQDLQWLALKENLKEFLEDTDNQEQQKPYSNQYAPFFNYKQTNTISLAEENSQHSFKKVMQFLLED